MGKKLVNKVLVIGWDAADWKVINPLIQQGKMPALKKLIDGGVSGRIKTLDPPLSPMLWTSIATGVRADKHGIHGFIEPSPDGQGLRPVTSTSRKVKAIWNILNQENYKSNVVAWWPSNPAEPINGVMVSNLYQGANKKLSKDWEMPKGTVHPKELSETLKELRVHPQELSAKMILPFVPNLKDNKDLLKAKRVSGVAKTLAHASSVHAATTYLLRETEWDFMAVYHDAIDHFSHLAMKFHPPQQAHITDENYDNYKHVVEAGYLFHDMMLERTLDLVDDDTTIILVSDHGFHCDHLRPKSIPKEPSGPAVEHNPYGVVIMNGPGIKKGEIITGASVIDITPTLLTLYGLPVGRDMEGKVLTGCFEEEIEPEYIDTWEDVDGEHGMHDADLKEDPWAAQEAMQQLVELGYIDALDDDKTAQVEKMKYESRYYVARNMINGGRIPDGIKELEEIFEATKINRYGKRLAGAYLNIGAFSKCEKLIEQLKVVEKENLEAMKDERKKKDPNDPFADRGLEEPMYLEYVEGLLHLAKNRINQALPILEKVQERNKSNIGVCLNIAKVHLSRKNYQLAADQYIKALAIDEENTASHHGLGLAFLRLNKIQEAIEEFLSALELNFYHVRSHYHLGEAYAKLGEFDEALQAFTMATRLSPGMTKAHQWLAKIYKEELNDSEKAKEHEEFIETNILDEIVVISGLPYSGSSLLTNVLKAGGLDVCYDQNISGRADVYEKDSLSNEEEKLNLDRDWLDIAAGKTIRMKSPLLNYLPQKYSYKIVLVDRAIDDIMHTYQQMGETRVKPGTLPVALLNQLQSNIDKVNAWVDAQPLVDIYTIDYDELLSDPKEQLEKLGQFLGKTLDEDNMIKELNERLNSLESKL
jgi:predicted AlkP superfamily phosphohydrolase/phosphomutase/tetratricopeptide (TPR) repeat protein